MAKGLLASLSLLFLASVVPTLTEAGVYPCFHHSNKTDSWMMQAFNSTGGDSAHFQSTKVLGYLNGSTPAVSLSLWTKFQAQQNSPLGLLFGVEDIQLNRDVLQLTWDFQTNTPGLSLVMQDGRTLYFFGNSSIALAPDQWRLVSFVIDFANNRVQLYVNSIIVYNGAANLTAGIRSYTKSEADLLGYVGAYDTFRNDAIQGLFGDMTIFHRAATADDIESVSNFRLPEISCVNSWPANKQHHATWPAGAMSYRFFTVEVKHSFGSFIASQWSVPYSKITMSASLKHTLIISSNFYYWMHYNTSDAGMLLSSTAGAGGDATVKFNWSPRPNAPNASQDWGNMVVWQMKVFFTVSNYPATGAAMNKVEGLVPPQWQSEVGSTMLDVTQSVFYDSVTMQPATASSTSVYLQFLMPYLDNVTLKFTFGTGIDATFDSTMNSTVTMANHPSWTTGDSNFPVQVFTSQINQLTVMSGLNAGDKVSLHFNDKLNPQGVSCWNKGSDASVQKYTVVSMPNPYVNDQTGVRPLNVININPALESQPGFYTACIYPGGMMGGQDYDAIGSYSFPAFVQLVNPPANGFPLRSGLITNLLHLGLNYSSSIFHGKINIDYFASVGGEANLMPQPGDSLGNASEGLVWTELAVADGQFGASNSQSANNLWIQYFALAFWSNYSTSVSMNAKHCGGLYIWVNGVKQHDHADCEPQGETVSFTVNKGWNQVIFKLADVITSSYLRISATHQGQVFWAYQVPSDRADPQSASYSNLCLDAKTNGASAMTCLTPNEYYVTQAECYVRGCCFDAKTSNCTQPTTTPLPYRWDARCGSRNPAPAGTPSICNPKSASGSTCCSEHGWCGSDARAYCHNPGAVDYNFDNVPGGRCMYKPWGNGQRCYGAPYTVYDYGMTASSCLYLCEQNPRCTGYTLGRNFGFNYYAMCMIYLDQECNQTITDKKVSTTYKRFCSCNMQQNCTNCYNKFQFSSYNMGSGIGVAACNGLCARSIECTGTSYRNDNCYFINKGDMVVLNTSSGNAADQVSMYTCPGLKTSVAPQPPLPSDADEDTTGISMYGNWDYIGCQDSGSYALAETYNGKNFWMANNMTVFGCYQYCLNNGALYFALGNGNICTCGVRPTLTEQPRSYDNSKLYCNMTCSGNQTETCGGRRNSAVYQIRTFQGVCQNGFVQNGDRCYQYNNDTNARNWTAAAAFCYNQGARLTSISNEAENQFLLSLTYIQGPNMKNSANTRTWVGARDLGTYGFEWLDGLNWDFSNWRPNEPNSGGEISLDEGCLEIFSNYPTPYKGSWNDRLCRDKLPFVCEMPSNTSQTQYAVPVVETGTAYGAYACRSWAEVLPVSAPYYEAYWQLNSQTDGIFADTSVYGRSMRYMNDNGAITTPTITNSLHGQAIKFSGQDYLQGTSVFNVTGLDLSVCAWVNPTSVANNVTIIGKGSNSINGGNVIALHLVDGKLCGELNGMMTCDLTDIPVNAWTHLCMSYKYPHVMLYVNGSATTYNVNIFAGSIEGSISPFLIGWSSDSAATTASRFMGSIDEVLLVAASIESTVVKYIYHCTLDAAPLTEIPHYAASTRGVTLSGFNFRKGQRIVISPKPCNQATVNPGDFTEALALFLSQTSLDDPSRATATFYPRGLEPGVWNLCVASPMDAQLFNIDIGFKLRVAQLSTVNGKSLGRIEKSQLPSTFTLAGNYLSMNNVIAISSTAQCYNGVIGLASFNSFTIDAQGSASATIQVPAIADPAVDELYLCWGVSMSAIDQFQYQDDDGSSYMMTYNVQNTGVAIALTLNGVRSKIVATTDGNSVLFDAFRYKFGNRDDANNYVVPCGSLDNFGDDFYLAVTMGEFTDYILPRQGASVCDVVTATMQDRPYSWTSINPASANFDGTAIRVMHAPTSRLGGSQAGFSNEDGRLYLSSWGSAEFSINNRGGCCQSVASQPLAWNQPFTMVAVERNDTSLYSNVLDQPNAAFTGVPFTMNIRMIDIHAQTTDENVTIQYTVSTLFNGVAGDYLPMTVQSTDFYRQNFTFTAPSTWSVANRTATVTIMAQIMGSNPKKLVLKKTQIVAQITIYNLPEHATPVEYEGPVRTYMGWGAAPQMFSQSSTDNAFEVDWFEYRGGEMNQQPTNGTWEKAMIPFYNSDQMTTVWNQYKPMPMSFTNDYGEFELSRNSINYYTFAVYTPEDQAVTFYLGVVRGMRVYVGGAEISNPSKRNTMYAVNNVQLKAGWTQVVVKAQAATDFFSNYRYKFFVQILGSAIATNYELIQGIPPETIEIVPKQPISNFLALGGENLASGFTGQLSSDPFTPTSSEMEIRPKRDQPTGSTTWTAEEFSAGLVLIPGGVLSYLGLGLYAAASGPYNFELQLHDAPCKIILNGQQAFYSPSSSTGMQVATLQLNLGWNQILIKFAATTTASFSMSLAAPTSSGATPVASNLAYAVSIPMQLPRGTVGTLTGQMKYFMGMENIQESYGIPLNKTAYDLDTFFNPNVEPKYLQNVSLPVSRTMMPFTWYSYINANGDLTFRHGYGGHFAEYFYLAIYSPVTQTISGDINHNQGIKLWMDGNSVLETRLPGDTNFNNFPLTKGWHKMFWRFTAPDDFVVVAENTATSHGDAHGMCKTQNLQLCSVSAWCPLGQPRNGYIPYPANTSGPGKWYAPVSDATNAWILVGDNNQDINSCSTSFVGTNVQNAVVACCNNVSNTPKLQITVSAESGYEHLGWAFNVPSPFIPNPTITLSNINGRTVYATLSTNTVGSSIKYLIIPAADVPSNTNFPSMNNGMLYTAGTKISIRANSAIYAVAYVLDTNQTSIMSYQMVTVNSNPLVNRTKFLSQVSSTANLIGMDPGDYVCLVRNDQTTLKASLMANADTADATNKSNVFSGMIKIAPDASLLVPTGLSAGSYQAIYYPGWVAPGPGIVRPAVIIPGAAANLITLYDLNLQNSTMGPALSLYARYSKGTYNMTFIGGGVMPGDQVMFLNNYRYQQTYEQECTSANCNAGWHNYQIDERSGNRQYLVSNAAGQTSGEFQVYNNRAIGNCICYVAIHNENSGQYFGVENMISAYANPAWTDMFPTTEAPPPPPPTPIPTAEPPTPAPPTPSTTTTGTNAPIVTVSPAPPTPQPPVPPGVVLPTITSVSPYNVVSGKELNLGGTFTPGTKYQIGFNSKSSYSASNQPVTPTAVIKSLTDTLMVLTITSHAGMSGEWEPTVSVGEVSISPTVPAGQKSVFLPEPLAPTITGASGACCSDTTKCKNGAVITVSGSNFNAYTSGYQVLSFMTSATATTVTNDVQCIVDSLTVTESLFECTLSFSSNFDSTTAKNYWIKAGVKSLPSTIVYGPVAEGAFTFGGNGLNQAGWSGAAAKTTTFAPGASADKGGLSGATLAVIIVGGVLVLVVIVAIVMKLRAGAARRARVDMDYIEESFLPNNGEDLNRNERSGNIQNNESLHSIKGVEGM